MKKKKKQNDKYKCLKVPITAILPKNKDREKRNMIILQGCNFTC